MTAPPHRAVSGFYASFFTCINKYVFEQEKPEKDDFERRKKIGSKGKILFNILRKYFEMFLTYTLSKMSKNIFAYSFVSEHFKTFFLFWEKTCIF